VVFLLLAASTLHHPDAAARQRSRASFESLMTLAVENGFAQADDLRQRLESGNWTERSFTLAKAALGDVEPDAMADALQRGGFDHPMLATGFLRTGSNAPAALQ
jgi:hypothetical protein